MANRVLPDEALEDILTYERTLIDLGLVDPDEPLPAHSLLHRRIELRKLHRIHAEIAAKGDV